MSLPFKRHALAAVLLLIGSAAHAQTFPARPIRMIIPAGPGGGVDTIARLVAQHLSSSFDQPVVMDNRPGAGTMLASELTANAPADGHTILMATNSHAINAGLHKKLRYDPVEDFATVSLIASLAYLVVAHPSIPARSVSEFIALAKQRPGEFHFASAGSGSGTHLAFELLVSMAHIRMVHVPYKSGSAALISLVGGHVQFMISNTINSRPHVVSGRLNALAITSPKRSALYPHVPTVSESGLPGYQADAWYGALVPARTPAQIVAQLNREMVAIIGRGDVRTKLVAQGAEVIGSTPEAFSAVLRNDINKWAKVIAGLKLQAD